MAKPAKKQATLLATLAAVSLLLLLIHIGDAAAVPHDAERVSVPRGHSDQLNRPSFINYDGLRADDVPGRRGLDRPLAMATKLYQRGCQVEERCRGSR